MPALLDLSNELLYQVIDQIHPNDILNFALTRKDIHHLAEEALKIHFDRSKYFTHLFLDGCHRHDESSHPLGMLRSICMDWRRVEYIKGITVECCMHPPDRGLYSEDEEEADTLKFKTEKKEHMIFSQATIAAIQGYIKAKVAELHLSHRTCFDMGELCSQAASGEGSAMLSLLLLFTPNLEALNLIQFSWDIDRLQHTVHAIKQRYVGQRSNAPKPLSKLNHVKVVGIPESGKPVDFGTLTWFAGLPSVRVLEGNFTIGSYKLDPEVELLPHTSNVEKIQLLNSAVHPNRIEQLLVGIKALLNFSYEHNSDIAEGCGIEVHKLLPLLHRHTKQSLETLVLWGTPELVGGESSDIVGKCIRGMKVLRVLSLTFWIYVEMRIWVGTIEGRKTRIDVQPLVYSLPPSVEYVNLGNFPDFARISELFVDFAEKKDLLLPKLKTVDLALNVIEAEDEEWRKLEEMCGKLGVRLDRPDPSQHALGT